MIEQELLSRFMRGWGRELSLRCAEMGALSFCVQIASRMLTTDHITSTAAFSLPPQTPQGPR